MEELKPCPFCGGETKLITDEWLGSKNFSVWCKCGLIARFVKGEWLDDYVINAWNTRYQPTCTNLYHKGSSLGEGGFRCSVCDAEAEGDNPTYCYRCGAKVVD